MCSDPEFWDDGKVTCRQTMGGGKKQKRGLSNWKVNRKLQGSIVSISQLPWAQATQFGSANTSWGLAPFQRGQRGSRHHRSDRGRQCGAGARAGGLTHTQTSSAMRTVHTEHTEPRGGVEPPGKGPAETWRVGCIWKVSEGTGRVKAEAEGTRGQRPEKATEGREGRKAGRGRTEGGGG